MVVARLKFFIRKKLVNEPQRHSTTS